MSGTISAIIITFNEEQDIEDCLESVAFCDEIVVVDSGSTDATRNIAARLGARVIVNPWPGFSKQKNLAVSLATSDWILHVDADERVTAESRDEILAAIRAPAQPHNGFFLPRLNYWLGRPIRYGGWSPDYGMRLFRRGHATCVGESHEMFVVDGPTGRLKHPLLHYSYWNVGEHVERAVLRAAPLDARELAQGGRLCWLPPRDLWAAVGRQLRDGPRSPQAFRMLYKTRVKNRLEFVWMLPLWPFVRFVQRYVVRQGFRDGAAGFWIAMLSAVYDAVRCALIWERHAAAAGTVTSRPYVLRIEPTYDTAPVAEAKRP